MNYFELFEIPIAPAVDKSLLERKYFALQKKHHPDRFVNADDAESESMLQQSATVNKAYSIFKNSQKTIEYFLQVNGLIQTDEKYNLPPDFLLEMMELNESLTEENERGIENKVVEFEENIYKEIQPVIEQYTSNTSKQELGKLKEYYYKKKYLQRILDRLGV